MPPKSSLRALQLGTGINTGTVIVGLMGSGEHISNYTIFGRDVNLASRLEGVSGSGRIIISESTHAHLRRHDPVLAATCAELPSVTVKGIAPPSAFLKSPGRRRRTPADPAPGARLLEPEPPEGRGSNRRSTQMDADKPGDGLTWSTGCRRPALWICIRVM